MTIYLVKNIYNTRNLYRFYCYNNLYDEDKKRYITFAEADEEIRKDKDM
jgi:hypothetical protein